MTDKRYTFQEVKEKYFPKMVAEEKKRWLCRNFMCAHRNLDEDWYCQRCGRNRNNDR